MRYIVYTCIITATYLAPNQHGIHRFHDHMAEDGTSSGIGLETWWRHQMEIFSALLAICAGNSPVPGEFPTQRPVTRSLDVFFDLRLNKRLSKQLWGWWFETPSHPLWRHRNGPEHAFSLAHTMAHSTRDRNMNVILFCRILRWHCPAGIECYRAPVMNMNISHESLREEDNILWVWKWKNSTGPCISEKDSYNALPRIYTARQLRGIALLVPPFCLRDCGNLCQSQYKAPDNISKTSSDPLTKFNGHQFCPVLVILLSREC